MNFYSLKQFGKNAICIKYRIKKRLFSLFLIKSKHYISKNGYLCSVNNLNKYSQNNFTKNINNK